MSDQSESSLSPTPQNPAVARCAYAWERTYDLISLQPKKERMKEDYDGFAEDEARDAFRDAMPPLSGHQNIQDFIACTAYAMLHGILRYEDCERLLECAKIALTAVRAQPRTGPGASA